MIPFSSLAEFWEAYQPMQSSGWVIVYMQQDNASLLMALANPLTEQHVEACVADVGVKDVETFARHCRHHFITNVPSRFGLFRPEVKKVLTEYPDWQTFHSAWLAGGPAVMQSNIPLLFDFPSDEEYQSMRLRGLDFAGYQRLLVVIYQYRKQQFQLIFIKGVDAAAFMLLKQQLITLYEQAAPHLIKRAANA